jgi:alkanesulfonate monooxygenase SsuD/methylene tetrahydromethanopterin reductase-like flavin-dependent oxidoreductase (luciferase family)
MDKVFQQHCQAIGRNAKQVTRTVMREVIIGETDKEAQAKASKFTPSDRDPDEYAETTIIGTPEQVIDRIRELQKIGMTYFILYFKDAVDLTPLEIFSKSVMRKMKS